MNDLVASGMPATAWGEGQPRAPAQAGGRLAAVHDIPVQLTVVLGRTRMRISELLQLGRGAVIELDRKAAEPVEILVNSRLVARGEVVLVEGRIGVTVTEIVGP